MSLMRKVAQNTALQFAGKIIGTALGFGATVLLLRYLGDERYGNYTTALAYLQLFGIVMDLGLYIVMLKHIGSEENKDGNLLNNIFTARFTTAVLFLAIACSLVWFIPAYPAIVKWSVIVVAINFFFITMNQLLMGIYQHNFAMGKVALAEIAGKVLLFVGTLLVIFVFKAGLLAIMLTVVVGGGTQFLWLWIGSRQYATIKPRFDWGVWKRLFRESWPIAISIALNLIYFKADTILLGLLRSQEEVGIYGAPYKMLEVIITLPAMIVGLVMPVLGKAYNKRDMVEFKNVYQQAFDAVMVVAVPMVVGTLMVADPFMQLVAGAEFTENQAALGSILRILIFAVGMIFVGTLTGYVIVIINKQRAMIPAYAFVAVSATLGYFYFIPRFSYFGAAAVTVYSETMIMLIALAMIYRTTKILPSLKRSFRILLASGLMAAAIYLAMDWHVAAVIVVGVLVYPVGLIVFRAFDRQQLQSFLALRS